MRGLDGIIRQYFSGVELDKHRAVRLHLFERDGQAEVVKQKELEFQVV